MKVIMGRYSLLKRANFLGPYTRAAAQATVRRQGGDPNPWGDWPHGPPEPHSTTALVVAAPIEHLSAMSTIHIAEYPKQAVLQSIPKVQGARWKRKKSEQDKMNHGIEQLRSYNMPGNAGSEVVRKIHDEVGRAAGCEIADEGLSLDPTGIQDKAFAHLVSTSFSRHQ